MHDDGARLYCTRSSDSSGDRWQVQPLHFSLFNCSDHRLSPVPLGRFRGATHLTRFAFRALARDVHAQRCLTVLRALAQSSSFGVSECIMSSLPQHNRCALLDLNELSKVLEQPLSSLRRWIHRPPAGFPAPIRLGRKIVFRYAEVEAWALGSATDRPAASACVSPKDASLSLRRRGRPRNTPPKA